MCSYLVYHLFFGAVAALSLVISLPSASGSKAQMVAPHGAGETTIPVTPEVTCHSWRLLTTFGSYSVIPEVIIRACSHGGCWLRPVSVDVPGSAPFPWRSLTWTCSLRGRSFVPAPAEVTCLGSLWQRLIAQLVSSLWSMELLIVSICVYKPKGSWGTGTF